MEYLIFLLPFGVALVVRLYHKYRILILFYPYTWLLTLALNWGLNLFSNEEMIAILLPASFFGFVGPEIWGLFRNSIDATSSIPRNISIILVGGGVIYLLRNPELLGTLISLGVMILGSLIIIFPFNRNTKGG